jgi:hypothetical protein
MTKAKKTKKQSAAEWLEEYRRMEANRAPDPEEMFEMRAAFGPGVKVVNVITGRTITT